MSEENKDLIAEEISAEEKNEVNDDAGESNAARRIRMLGISVEEEPPKEPIKKAGFFENFWYHYKFHTIAVVFAVFVLTVGILQLVGKTNPDIYIMYAGEKFYENTNGIITVNGHNGPLYFLGAVVASYTSAIATIRAYLSIWSPFIPNGYPEPSYLS